MTLYGGRYEVRQFDASVSGPLFAIWGGDVQLAVGVDYRRESYEFNGSAAAAADQPDIFNVAFDNINALTPKNRTVKAAYAEVLIPIFRNLDIIARGPDRRLYRLRHHDESEGRRSSSGRSNRSCSAARTTPASGSRRSTRSSTARPSRPQRPGEQLVDPFACPSLVVSACPDPRLREHHSGHRSPAAISTLGPETAKQYNVGVVLQPLRRFSASVDWWSIAVDNTIAELTTLQLLENADALSRAVPARRTGRTIVAARPALDQRRRAADAGHRSRAARRPSTGWAARSTPASTAPICSRSARSCYRDRAL